MYVYVCMQTFLIKIILQFNACERHMYAHMDIFMHLKASFTELFLFFFSFCILYHSINSAIYLLTCSHVYKSVISRKRCIFFFFFFFFFSRKLKICSLTPFSITVDYRMNSVYGDFFFHNG